MKHILATKRSAVFLIGGILCLATGTFLACGLQYVEMNKGWYIGYMIIAYIVGFTNLVLYGREDK